MTAYKFLQPKKDIMAKPNKKFEWIATYVFNNGDTHVIANSLYGDNAAEAMSYANGFVTRILEKDGNPNGIYIVSANVTIKPKRGRRPKTTATV